jgi:C2 domain
MTEEEIEMEHIKDSQHWIDSGSGKLGKIYIEVLGCDGLPNLDTGGFLGNKTDAFVSIVFEDSVVQTDIIDDCLCPRWLPWMKRAFVFHMAHSSSQLLVGVFDNDIGMDDHDLIGKVSVDLTNLHKDTIYTLQYDIFKSSQMSTRKAKGSITLRIRMEIDDERKLLLACLEPPPDVYVNVKTRKEFRVVRWTTAGKYDMDSYSMKVMNS